MSRSLPILPEVLATKAWTLAKQVFPPPFIHSVILALPSTPDPRTTPQVLKVRVGDANNPKPYQAKLTGFDLAVANAKAEASPLTTFFWLLTDNQTIIRDLAEVSKVKPSTSSCTHIKRAMQALLRNRKSTNIAIIWCP